MYFNQKGRQVLCIGLVILGIAVVVVGCVSLVLVFRWGVRRVLRSRSDHQFRHESLLHAYNSNVTQVEYPAWFQAAISSANVVHLEGGRPIRLSANAILW